MSIEETTQMAKIEAARSETTENLLQKLTSYVVKNTSIEAGNLLIDNYVWPQFAIPLADVLVEAEKENGSPSRKFMLAWIDIDSARSKDYSASCTMFDLNRNDLSPDECRNLMDRLARDRNGVYQGEIGSVESGFDCTAFSCAITAVTQAFLENPNDSFSQKLIEDFKLLIGALYPTKDGVISLVNNYFEDTVGDTVGFMGFCGMHSLQRQSDGILKLEKSSFV